MSYNTSSVKAKVAKKRRAIRARRGSVNFEIYPLKTNNHFYLVVYNCLTKQEMFRFSTLNLENAKNNVESAGKVGAEVAKWCVANNIPSVYFNKLRYKFHGKLASASSAFNEVFNK